MIELIIIIISIFLTGYFAAGETSMTSLEKADLKKILKQKKKNNWAYSAWIENPNRILATFLIGNNLMVVIASVLMTSLSHNFALRKGFNINRTATFSSLILIFFVLLFGEILPKIYARHNKEKISDLTIESIVLASMLLTPIVKILLFISNKITSIFHQIEQKEVPFFNDEEMEIMLKIGEKEGALKKQEREIITSILDLEELRVKDTMTPRASIFSVNIDEPQDILFKKMIDSKYSRIPAFKGTTDNIVGIIYTKDIINAYRNKDLILIQDLLRPVYFIPETKKLKELLLEFQKGIHMAVSINEYGEVVGIITIEDIIEEIVGDILDEYDIEESNIITVSDKEYIVSGSAKIEEVENKLNIKLDTEYFDTIGGFVIDLFGKIPLKNETIEYKKIIFIVEQSEKRRIHRLRIIKK